MTKPEKTTYLGIRIPLELKEEFERLAARGDLTLTQLVRQAMREYLAQRKAA